MFTENPKAPTTSPLKNPKTTINSPLEKLTSSDVSPLKIPKSALLNPNYYDDEFFDSVETDPKWDRELDFEGEPIYTPEPDLYPDREYFSLDAVFSNTDCKDEDWLDKLGPFLSMFLFLWV